MIDKFIYKFCITVVLFTINFGCNQSKESRTGEQDSLIKKENLLQVKNNLYKDIKTGVYYFRFHHIPIESDHESRFIAILNNAGDSIRDINEKAFNHIFNLFVDGKYVFKIVNKYGQYEVHTLPIDSLHKGCYFEESNYRIADNRIEYYHGVGVSMCNTSPNQILTFQLPKSEEFHVIDIDGHDCATINGQVLIDGCLVPDNIGDSMLYSRITSAIRKKEFKTKLCY